MSTNENVSKSKQKRAERQKRNEQIKREGVIGSIVGILAIVLIIGAVVWSIVASINKKASQVEPNNDFGKYITDEGFVEGIKAASIVTLPDDYNNIVVPKSEIEYTEDEWQEEMANQLDSHKIVNSEYAEAIANGDTINLDYVGTVDGVEFEGGSTNGSGSSLEIGSGSFIPGFEDQIIGHKVGENFDIDVTFPEDYSSEELSGKDAVFNITINGVYEQGEFTDEFVAENLKAYASTVDEYRKYIEEKNYEERLDTYIANYLDENSTLSKYPEKYLNQLKALKMYSDQSSYEYMNQMYVQMYGYGASSFLEYMGMSQEQYDISVIDSAMKAEVSALARQAIAEKEGIRVTEDDMKSYVEETYGEDSYDSILESYGKPYIAQTTLDSLVQKYLKSNATVQ